jgi:hypothetical protein
MSVVAGREVERPAHSRHGQKHDDQLFLAEDRVPNESVQEPGQSAAPFLYEGAIVRQMVTIDWELLARQFSGLEQELLTSDSLWWQERQHSEWVALV